MNYISESLWNFEKAAVITPKDMMMKRAYNGEHKLEGLLTVTFVNKHTGDQQTGSVCKNQFNWLSANLFCQLLHYQFGELDDIPGTMYVKYI